MTIYIDIEEVYQIHERMLEIGGGRTEVRDFTLLHSAVERPKATFGGHFLYTTLWLKAAALIQSLIKNHAFNDGNKRTGFFSTLRFLRLNSYTIVCSKKELIHFTLSIDISNISLEQIANWLKKNSKRI